MTKEQFRIALAGCGCTLRDGNVYYEADDLIECLEDMKLFDSVELEPCEDCISRADAFKALQIKGDYNTLNEVYERLEKLPSVTPKWIPVSERLPEDFEDVLVWYEYFRYGDYYRMFQTYGIGCYISNTGTWSGDPGTGTKAKVIAWMPLPEPYKEVEE